MQAIRVPDQISDIVGLQAQLDARARTSTHAGAPTVNDDATEGYAAGDVWIDANGDVALYDCKDATAGAAVWRERPLLSSDGDLLVNSLRPGLIAQDDDESVPAIAVLSAIVDDVADPTTTYRMTVGDGETPQGISIDGLSSSAVVAVSAGASASANGNALKVAYTKAKVLTPNGAALSATNRAAVLIGPGAYDFGSTGLTLDTQFVDLIGINRDSTLLKCSSSTVLQTADDVLVREMILECTSATSLTNSASDPAAYFPNASLTNAKLVRVICRGTNNGRSTRTHTIFAGRYEDCEANTIRAFGGGSGGGFSGYALRCISTASGSAAAFGAEPGVGGIGFSGTAVDCRGGTYSFGGAATSGNGVFTGSATNCVGGNQSFGGSISVATTCSGTLVNCVGGEFSFGGRTSGTAASLFSGTATNCTGGQRAFGGGHSTGTASFTGTATNCVGGQYAFGSNSAGTGVISSTARLYYCRGGADSFGVKDGSAKAFFCIKDAAQYSGNDA